MSREAVLERIHRRSRFSMIVIGGGATGAGVAWDAAARGLSVLLLERGDFGQGTSSRSTKLIHGGVRYLAQGQLGLVREALGERSWLLRNASEFVHPLSFVIPTANAFEQLKFRVGLAAYDVLARDSQLPRAQSVASGELNPLRALIMNFRSAVTYADAQFDDTRLLLAVLGRAVAHGAFVLNYAEVSTFLRRADQKICGVLIRDLESGQNIEVQADIVINAGGPQVSDIGRLDDPTDAPTITLSRGSHVVVAREFWPRDDALLIPRTPDGRVMFAIPWHQHVLLGTTDVATHDANSPCASREEIDYILEVAGHYLRRAPTRENILSCFAGVRPLLTNDAASSTARVSREYQISVNRHGLVSIVGGKWTTFRRMAEACVERALAHHGLSAKPCMTTYDSISSAFTLHSSEARENNSVVEDSTPLVAGLPYTAADARRAIRFEMARHIDDILARRTRALFLNARAAIEAAPSVAQLLAAELGHPKAWIEHELSIFQQLSQQFLLDENN